MAALSVAQMGLILVVVACFSLWLWTVGTDPNLQARTDLAEPGVTSFRFSAVVFFAVFAVSLWLLFQTQFDLCGFLGFWWPGMPHDIFRWSCVTLPKMQ